METKDVPSPQKTGVPAPGKRPVPTFYLKVRLHCCATCFRRAKERLQKIHGVIAINVDAKQELLAVSGIVDPQKLIDKFAEWGKKAVLWTPQKDPAQFSNINTNIGQEYSAQDSEKAHESCCTEDDTDSDSADDRGSSTITWQHPDLAYKLAAAPNTKEGKKHCWLLRLFGKTRKGDKLQGAGGANSGGPGAKSGPRPNGMRPAFNSFPPRRPMLSTYGGPMSFYPPNYGERQPSYGSMYNNMPMMYGRHAMPPYPYHHHQQPVMHHHLLPPPAPRFGFSGPISPSLMNPMIHYTRYEDNYL